MARFIRLIDSYDREIYIRPSRVNRIYTAGPTPAIVLAGEGGAMYLSARYSATRLAVEIGGEDYEIIPFDK